jgi:hypothetical protein
MTMTEVQPEADPEVVVPLDRRAAEKLDVRIRRMADAARGDLETVGRLLDEAKAGGIHDVLGFKSWPAYVADAVGGRLHLSGDARAAMVGLLAGEGMSERAIADATGVSKTTVHRDLGQVVHNGPPDSGPAETAPSPDPNESAESGGAAPEPAPLAEPPATTGLDGKTYPPKPKPKPDPAPKPKPDKPRRKLVVIPVGYRVRWIDIVGESLEICLSDEGDDGREELLVRIEYEAGEELADRIDEYLHESTDTP